MGVQLLDKTRKINKLLHNNNSNMVVFNDICEVLSEILESNILVISKKGNVLGIKERAGITVIHELICDNVGEHIDTLLNERLLSILSTKENVNLITLGFTGDGVSNTKPLLRLLISRGNGWERCLSTVTALPTKLTILFSASMEQPL